jgi:hypothetical protein
MTSRSSFASKRRPLSAIFLGDGPLAPSTSDLPDLPEPPSPGAASTRSGLPSPPATNSTGSGSTGDSRENVDLHSAPPLSSALTMRNERPTSRSSGASSPAGSGEYKREEGDEEEDMTARLNLGRRRGASQSNDHVVTLQRVMSLTQRNRMVCTVLPVYFLRDLNGISARRPLTNCHQCASTHLPRPKRLIPRVLLKFQLALQHQGRLLPATVLDQWNPQHYPARRRSASLAQLIPTHLMTNPLHHLHPSHRQTLS